MWRYQHFSLCLGLPPNLPLHSTPIALFPRAAQRGRTMQQHRELAFFFPNRNRKTDPCESESTGEIQWGKIWRRRSLILCINQCLPTVHFVTQTQRNPTQALRIRLWPKPPPASEMKPRVRKAWSGPKAAEPRVGKQDWHWENHPPKWYKPKWADCLPKRRNATSVLKGPLTRLRVSENNIQKVQDTIQTHSTYKTLGNSDPFTRKTANNRDQSKMILKLMKIFLKQL